MDTQADVLRKARSIQPHQWVLSSHREVHAQTIKALRRRGLIEVFDPKPPGLYFYRVQQ